MDHIRGGSVLVIDDEPSVRSLLCRALPLEGFRVAAAASGEEAVSLAAREGFDAAVCDIGLPGMDGVAVLKALKNIQPKMEVIMVTGNATAEAAIASLKAGAYDCVAKPYSLDHLADLVGRAVERRWNPGAFRVPRAEPAAPRPGPPGSRSGAGRGPLPYGPASPSSL